MRNRKITIGIIVALVVAVVSLGIAFAAFSATLNINGNATVESSNWNVYFSTGWPNYTDPGSTGISLPSNSFMEDGTAQSVSTTLTSNTFSWSATLKSPGDSITYWVSIVNAGDYDAAISLSGITFVEETGFFPNHYGSLTCTQNGVVTSEASTVCSHLQYYVNSIMDIYHNEDIEIGIVVKLDNENWAQDGSDLPKNPVTVTATPIVLTATQASSAH